MKIIETETIKRDIIQCSAAEWEIIEQIFDADETYTTDYTDYKLEELIVELRNAGEDDLANFLEGSDSDEVSFWS
jgi:hypothetical protein